MALNVAFGVKPKSIMSGRVFVIAIDFGAAALPTFLLESFLIYLSKLISLHSGVDMRPKVAILFCLGRLGAY